MTQLADNLSQVDARITAACERFQQNRPLLLAVSKTRSAEHIRQVYELGVRHFGENYLQEALSKQQALGDLAIEWHFIGPIQSNKAKSIAENFDWVHSVDRAKVASKLNQHCPEEKTLNICLQVNIDDSATKSGVSPDALTGLLSDCEPLSRLNIRGLMAIPDPGSQRQAFHHLAELLQSARQQFPHLPLDTLSMGMSGDLEAAIAEGSSIVRVGTDIFGPREPRRPD